MTALMNEGIAMRVAAVRARVAAACARADRDPRAVTIVAVSKTWPAEAVVAAWQAGISRFGENRVQEGVTKVARVRELLGRQADGPHWDLVGHLQTNKARTAAVAFDTVQSIDSTRVAQAVAACAPREMEVMVEVNVAGEATKSGVAPEALPGLVECCRALGLGLTGLMTVAPAIDDVECVRPVFRRLRALADAHSLAHCSMGMSNDFELAIEEGATHVRIGRAIFGERTA